MSVLFESVKIGNFEIRNRFVRSATYFALADDEGFIGEPSVALMKKLAEGVTLEDGFTQPDALSYASSENKREVGLEIHSGKNRIVRRMFEAVGYRVDKLDRVYFGGLTKKNLPRGKWRLLTEKEVNMLKMNAYE